MADRPNFLVIMSDQHNPNVLGCAGDSIVRTPNLDLLADRGVVFESAYSQSPLCVPSRMSFLTSRQPSDIRIWTNACILPSDVTTFAHSLGAAGYDTALLGRMHFVGPDQWHGFSERLVGSFTAVHPFGRTSSGPPDVRGGRTPSGAGWTTWRGAFAGPGKTVYQAYDEAVATAAARYLSERSKSGRRPFCAVVGFVLPHNPFVCPEGDWSYYLDRVEEPHIPDGYFERLHPAVKLWRKRRRMENLTDEEIRMARVGYYGIVAHLDRQVGVVLDALSRTPFEADTVVIFTADHGEMAGEHGLWGKPHFYEEAVSVPLIVSSPDRFRGGRRVDEVVSLIDIAPTLVGLAGAKPMPAASGTSLLPLLEEGRTEWANEAFSEHYDLSDGGEPQGRMVRKGRWKLVHHDGYRPQMFDLEADPHELNDLGEDPAHASLREELHQRVMAGWSAKEIGAELERRRAHHDLLGEWYDTVQPPDHGRWIAPDDANNVDAETIPPQDGG